MEMSKIGMNINIANYSTIIVISYALFFAGCVGKETNISIESPIITKSPSHLLLHQYKRLNQLLPKRL